jgi:hypothetical protein
MRRCPCRGSPGSGRWKSGCCLRCSSSPLLTSHFIHFDRSLRHCLTHSLTHSGSVLSAECGVDRRRSHGPHAQVHAPILKSARRASHRRWPRQQRGGCATRSLTHSLTNSLPPPPPFYSLNHSLISLSLICEQLSFRSKGLTADDIQGISSLLANTKELDLSDNDIDKLSRGFPMSLIALDLSSNRLPSLAGFENLRNIRMLRLQHNKITR